MAKVYIGLGTNLGDKEQNLRTAVHKIEERIGKIVSLSAFYATAPWGFTSDNAFLNAAVCAEIRLAAVDSFRCEIDRTFPLRSAKHPETACHDHYGYRCSEDNFLLFHNIICIAL